MSFRFCDAEPAATDLPAEINELRGLIERLDLPARDQLRDVEHRLELSLQKRNQVLNLLQDALTEARHEQHHLSFDLFATRNERDELRSRLDEFRRDF